MRIASFIKLRIRFSNSQFACIAVIASASEAIHAATKESVDCFVAEPVIGRAMTVRLFYDDDPYHDTPITTRKGRIAGSGIVAARIVHHLGKGRGRREVAESRLGDWA